MYCNIVLFHHFWYSTIIIVIVEDDLVWLRKSTVMFLFHYHGIQVHSASLKILIKIIHNFFISLSITLLWIIIYKLRTYRKK
jgi:hypothetical protein